LGLCRPGNESTGEHDNKAAPGPPFILERRKYINLVQRSTDSTKTIIDGGENQ
jgi:hypothetical protein